MIKRLHSGGIITNYDCSASCRHCLYKSSPCRTGGFIENRMLTELLRRGRRLGCSSFHIGGGEPFLYPDRLLDTVRLFRSEGAGIDYLETNASWYRDPESADSILSELRMAGCRTVMVSVCPFHMEFVPLEKVDGVLAACRRTGMNYFVWQEQYYRELSEFDKSRTHSHRELRAEYGEDYIYSAAGRYGLTLNGRALASLKKYLPAFPAEKIAAEAGPCTELESGSHFHFDLYGNFIPPGCVGLSLPAEVLGTGEERNSRKYPIFSMLREKGVPALFEEAEERGFSPNPDGYVSKCDLCLGIRTFFVEAEGMETLPDLQPAEFYRVS